MVNGEAPVNLNLNGNVNYILVATYGVLSQHPSSALITATRE